MTVIYVLAILAILIKVKPQLWAAALCFAGFCIVLTWWFSLKPSNDGDWQADAARTAWVEINGDRVTIHNLRNCDYITKTDYSNCWSDRTVYLSQLRYADLFFTTWGPKYIGHPIVSFQFGDNDHIAFSIEARYKVGQVYSAILGFFRQYELIFIAADERDVIRLRTNYRKDEQVFSVSHHCVGGPGAQDIPHLCRLPEQVARSSRVVQRADPKLHHHARYQDRRGHEESPALELPASAERHAG